MDAAKIRLSQKEMELVTNGDWILTKNAIIEKVVALLASLQEEQQAYVNSFPGELPGIIKSSTAKISKGEKYKGLPYLLLDYPRYFKEEDVLAIRTMFWWGNFFSVTLHLSGAPGSAFAYKIIDAYDLLRNKDFYYCINDKQWEHDLSPENYIPLAGIDKTAFGELVWKKDFIKIVRSFPLGQWDDAGTLLLDSFKEIIGILGDQLPSR